jgi:hypothetical protein
MVARVKWSDKRVCLEGFEVGLPAASVRVRGAEAQDALQISTWLVARGAAFARVGVGEGFEWRQSLECSIAPGAPPAATP